MRRSMRSRIVAIMALEASYRRTPVHTLLYCFRFQGIGIGADEDGLGRNAEGTVYHRRIVD